MSTIKIFIGYIGQDMNRYFEFDIQKLTREKSKSLLLIQNNGYMILRTLHYYNNNFDCLLYIYIDFINDNINITPSICKYCKTSSIIFDNHCLCKKIYDTFDIFVPISMIL